MFSSFPELVFNFFQKKKKTFSQMTDDKAVYRMLVSRGLQTIPLRFKSCNTPLGSLPATDIAQIPLDSRSEIIETFLAFMLFNIKTFYMKVWFLSKTKLKHILGSVKG